MNQKELDKILDNHKEWLRTNGEKGKRANLERANLKRANLEGANLDYSCFPLWCGGLDVHIDDKQATQLLYHLVKNVQYSKNTSKALKKLCRIKSIIRQANKFHRVEECGKL